MSIYSTPSDSNLQISDITTNDVSTSAHGFAPKLWASSWSSWTPTFTNLTKGSATINAKYIQIGKTVHFRLSIVLAADSSVGTAPSFTLPVTAVSYGASAGEILIGTAEYLDAGVNSYMGVIALNSTTVSNFYRFAVGGSNVNKGSISATTPFTFGTSDEINATGTYEAA